MRISLYVAALAACAADANDETVDSWFGTTQAATEQLSDGDVTTTLTLVNGGATVGTATWRHVDETQSWSVGGVSGENRIDHAPAPREQALFLQSAWINTPAGYQAWTAASTKQPYVVYYTCSVYPFGPYCQAVSCSDGEFKCNTFICDDLGWGSCDLIAQ